MHNPVCPACAHRFAWVEALRDILGPTRRGTALWGTRCPACGADLRVPPSRVLLIAASGIFFGSQSSLLLLGRGVSPAGFWAASLFLVLGCYALAVFVLLDLETVT